MIFKTITTNSQYFPSLGISKKAKPYFHYFIINSRIILLKLGLLINVANYFKCQRRPGRPYTRPGLPSGSVRNQITQKWFSRKVVVLVVPIWFQDFLGTY